MSPLLGSSGGSSEYAFRGTLDDWPVAFDADLSAQNLLNQEPGSTVTATLTVTGLNYKARLTVDYPNTTVSINGGSPVSAKDADPEVYVRDNDVVAVNFQIPLTGTSSFNTIHGIDVKIGKRTGFWIIRTRPIDATPNTFSFTNRPNSELGVTTTSGLPVVISGLEQNFNFDLSVTGAGVSYYKNGVLSTASTIANNDTLYLEANSPITFSTLRTYTVSIGGISSLGIGGGISTTWTITTRAGDGTPNPFTFNDVPQANRLGVAYTSNSIPVTGIDSGPRSPDPLTDITAIPVGINLDAVSIGGAYEIRKSDGTLRYSPPTPSSEYFQNNVVGVYSASNYAYLNDTIAVRVTSAPLPNYSTTRNVTLTLGTGAGTVSDTYSVTTRPTPINTIPSPTGFSFPSLTGQNRGIDVFSNTITLSGMTSGDFGSAVSSSTTPTINPRFRVVRGGIEVKSYTAAEPFNVQNGDQITLRMTTPNPVTGNGDVTSTMRFEVFGTNTQVNDVVDGDGFTTTSGSTPATWSVSTKQRVCGINAFSFTNVTGINTSTNVVRTFTPSGFEIDCAHTAILSSNSPSYNFTGKGSPIVAIGATKRLDNIVPGEPIEVTVRSSGNFISTVTTNVSITNSEALNLTGPDQFYTSPDWTITTVGNTANWVLDLTATPVTDPTNTIPIGSTILLEWSSTNCLSINSVSWSATPPTTLNGNVTLSPSPVGSVTYSISAVVNPAAGNVADAPGGIATKTVTVYVGEDLTATFTPNNFTTILALPTIAGGPTVVSSEEMQIGGITAAITATNAANTTSRVNGIGAYTSPAKSLNNGDTISIQVPNNTAYLTSTGGSVTFSNGNGTKTFGVGASSCSPTSDFLRFPVSGVNWFSYRSNAIGSPIQYSNGSGGTTTINSGYILEFPQFASFVGTYGDYIASLPTFGGQIPSFGTIAPLAPINWQEALTTVFTIYNKQFWRISTDTVTTTPGYRRNPTISELSALLEQLAVNSLTERALGTPITNITDWVDDFISKTTVNEATGTGPTNTLRTVESTRTSFTTGLSVTGQVFNSCNNSVPLAFTV